AVAATNLTGGGAGGGAQRRTALIVARNLMRGSPGDPALAGWTKPPGTRNSPHTPGQRPDCGVAPHPPRPAPAGGAAPPATGALVGAGRRGPRHHRRPRMVGVVDAYPCPCGTQHRRPSCV